MEIVVLMLMSVLNSRVSARHQAPVRTQMAASSVSVQGVSNWMAVGLSVLIRTRARARRNAPTVKAPTDVGVRKASNCTCTSTSALTQTSVPPLPPHAARLLAPTRLAATPADAHPVTVLTTAGQSASRAPEVAVQPHVPLAVHQLGLEGSAVRALAATRALERVTALPPSALPLSAVWGGLGKKTTMRMSLSCSQLKAALLVR